MVAGNHKVFIDASCVVMLYAQQTILLYISKGPRYFEHNIPSYSTHIYMYKLQLYTIQYLLLIFWPRSIKIIYIYCLVTYIRDKKHMPFFFVLVYSSHLCFACIYIYVTIAMIYKKPTEARNSIT